jgi:hypothetical protein
MPFGQLESAIQALNVVGGNQSQNQRQRQDNQFGGHRKADRSKSWSKSRGHKKHCKKH